MSDNILDPFSAIEKDPGENDPALLANCSVTNIIAGARKRKSRSSLPPIREAGSGRFKPRFQSTQILDKKHFLLLGHCKNLTETILSLGGQILEGSIVDEPDKYGRVLKTSDTVQIPADEEIFCITDSDKGKLIILEAFAAGIPLMKSDWILAMKNKNQFIDPASPSCILYRIHNQTENILTHKYKRTKVFDNLVIHLALDGKINFRDELQKIAIRFGARVVTQQSDANDASVITVHDGSMWKSYVTNSFESSINVKLDWFTQSILQNKLMSKTSYKYTCSKKL